MKTILKYTIPALFIGTAIAIVAQAQVVPPQLFRKVGNNIYPLGNVASTTIGTSTAVGQFQKLTDANGNKYSTSSAATSVATGTVAALGSPLIVGAPTSSLSAFIYGDGTSSQIVNLNTKIQFPSPTMLATNGCFGSSTISDAGACANYIYQQVPSSTEIDYGNYSYAASTPVVRSISGKYILDKGISGGGTQWTFTPTYFAILSASSSTKQITYTTSSVPFSGEAVTAVGPSLPSGITVGTIYYIGQINVASGTFILYKNPGLTTTSTINGTGTGTLETPAFTYDVGQNQSYGWGNCGFSLNGPTNGSSTGFYFGGTLGARSATLCSGQVTGFYENIYLGDNTYFWTLDQEYSHRNAPNNVDGLIWMDATINAGEEINLIQSVLADHLPAATSTQGVHFQTSGFVDIECQGTAFDDTGVWLDWYDGEGNTFHAVNCRSENPGYASGWTNYVPFTTNTGNPNTSVEIDLTNYQFLNDGNGATAFPNMMQIGPGVMVNLSGVTAQANTYTGASTVTTFATLAAGSTITSTGFHNIGDTPGVTYLYGTRAVTAGYLSNAPTFIDSTLQVTGNITYYNGFYSNPQVQTTSSTLPSYAPAVQIANGTSSITYTMPTIVNNTGDTLTIANRGSANAILQATSTDLFFINNATSTSYTLAAGQSITITDDAAYWTVLSGTNLDHTTANTWTAQQTFTAPFVASSTQYYAAYFRNATSTTSSTVINWNNGNVQSVLLQTSTNISFSNAQAGGRYLLSIVQDGTGSRTVTTWPVSVQWSAGTAPTLTTTAGKMDIMTFVCEGISSTDCYGGANLNYSP